MTWRQSSQVEVCTALWVQWMEENQTLCRRNEDALSIALRCIASSQGKVCPARCKYHVSDRLDTIHTHIGKNHHLFSVCAPWPFVMTTDKKVQVVERVHRPEIMEQTTRKWPFIGGITPDFQVYSAPVIDCTLRTRACARAAPSYYTNRNKSGKHKVVNKVKHKFAKSTNSLNPQIR